MSEEAKFSIDVDIVGGLNDEQKKVFKLAAKRWEEVIVGVPVGGGGFCQRKETDLALVIKAAGKHIDGAGRVLGQAGPTRLRRSDSLPVQGMMQFDTADLDDMEQDGTLKDVILHEMGHVLGLGTLWSLKGLLKGSGTNNPVYVGPNAVKEYAKLRGEEQSNKPVPVANTGGRGTREGHWREITFDYELMTGYAEEEGLMPLSRMTVAALDDLGYIVNYDKADKYQLPPPPAAGVAVEEPAKRPRVRHYCEVEFPKAEKEKRFGWCL